jgi:3',5'-cyclic AMP phosphodiesterase CpdA
MPPQSSSADPVVRLAHFSDIHLTAKPLGWRARDFLTKRTTAWMNLKLRRGRRFRAAEAIVDAIVGEIRERGCDRIVFSGDATNMGFASELAAAARALPFDLPGIAVPGNHDYYVRSAVAAGLFEQRFAPWQTGNRIGAAIYPFAQRVGHCWLVGLNSATSNFLLWDARGGVGRPQSERLRELLRSLSPGPRILVTHYPIFLADENPELFWRRMRDWKAIQRIASEVGISLWLHGHRHSGYVLRPRLPDRPFTAVCAGSATQVGLWSYNEYSIVGNRLQMNRRTWSPDEGRFRDSDNAEIALFG